MTVKNASMIDYSKLPPECDQLCQWRPCLHKGEDKGHFQPGRGYTSYYAKPEYVCMTRLTRGCYAGIPGRGKRPDFRRMLDDLRKEVEEARVSQKARRIWMKHLAVLELVIKYYVEMHNDDKVVDVKED